MEIFKNTESSNGNTFKNSDIATILTVHIYVGAERIEWSAEQLEKDLEKMLGKLLNMLMI